MSQGTTKYLPPHRRTTVDKQSAILPFHSPPEIVTLSRKDWKHIKKLRKGNDITLPKHSIFFRGWSFINIEYLDKRKQTPTHRHRVYGDCNAASLYLRPSENANAKRGVIIKYRTIKPLRLFVLDAQGVKYLINELYGRNCECGGDDDRDNSCKINCDINFCRLIFAFGFHLGDQKVINKIKKLQKKYKICKVTAKTLLPSHSRNKHGIRTSIREEDRKLFYHLRMFLSHPRRKKYDGMISLTLNKSKFDHELILFEPINEKIQFDGGNLYKTCPSISQSINFSSPKNQSTLETCLKKFIHDPSLKQC